MPRTRRICRAVKVLAFDLNVSGKMNSVHSVSTSVIATASARRQPATITVRNKAKTAANNAEKTWANENRRKRRNNSILLCHPQARATPDSWAPESRSPRLPAMAPNSFSARDSGMIGAYPSLQRKRTYTSDSGWPAWLRSFAVGQASPRRSLSAKATSTIKN
jgi:hypothetical protein